MTSNVAVMHLSDSILYLSSLIGDQPRNIDCYIDYFGERPVRSGARRLRARAVSAIKRARSRLRRQRPA